MTKNKWIRKYGPKAVGLGMNAVGLVAPKYAAKRALDIFCTPRGGQIKSYQKKFLKTFSKKALDCNGHLVMTYDNKKKGPTVLFCHGWESNSFRWRKVVRHLKQTDINIILMDAPAHGNSGSDRFHALMYADMIDVVANHYKPEIIVGHSVGGYATLYHQYKFKPEFIKKLIILASPDKMTTISENYFRIIGLSKRIQKAYYALILKQFGQPIEYYEVNKYVREIDVPGILIHDKHDDINYYWEGEHIIKYWKSAELVTTEGLGHSLQSEEVYEKILQEIQATNSITHKS